MPLPLSPSASPGRARPHPSPRTPLLALAVVVGLGLAACSAPDDDSPADAPATGEDAASTDAPNRSPRPELVASLREDLELERHPSDGGGSARLVAGGGLDDDGATQTVTGATQAVTVGRPGRFTLRYRTGPLGIAEGGMIFLQVSPFWGWSTPQVEEPRAPGYTEVTTGAGGVELEPRTLDQQLLGVAVRGRGLEPGEEVEIVYGAGPAGATVDRYAEHASRLWIAVDGDGDGVRKVLAESPAVDVAPGPPARLLLLLPSTAHPGETVELTVAVVDAAGNAGIPFDGEIGLEVVAGAASVPAKVALAPADGGRITVEVTAGGGDGGDGDEEGDSIVRLRGTGPGGLAAESNPLQVAGRGYRIRWGDLQNHSNYSDGTGTPEDHLRYAREVAALDVYALTDHDHWGMLFLDSRPERWREIRELTERHHQPGRFVTLLGFEWTSWIHGHRHVLYFDGDGEVLSTLDPRYDTPQELWAALRGRRAMTIAHHSAGGPISTDWSIPPDPELEPVTEIVSVHGSSEAMDSPSTIYRPVPGNFVRDALDRGYRLGFLGSSDGHDGHPGLAHLASPTGGLAAILSDELTRDGIYRALQERRVYATSGPRIILRTAFGGHPIGAEIAVGDGGPEPGDRVPGVPADALIVQVIAPGEVSHVDLVRSGRVVESVDCGGARQCSFGRRFGDLEAGEYLYLRAVQTDGGAAWSSPFFFVSPQ